MDGGVHLTFALALLVMVLLLRRTALFTCSCRGLVIILSALILRVLTFPLHHSNAMSMFLMPLPVWSNSATTA